MLLDKQLMSAAEAAKIRVQLPPPDRYVTLLKQRHVQVHTVCR